MRVSKCVLPMYGARVPYADCCLLSTRYNQFKACMTPSKTFITYQVILIVNKCTSEYIYEFIIFLNMFSSKILLFSRSVLFFIRF